SAKAAAVRAPSGVDGQALKHAVFGNPPKNPPPPSPIAGVTITARDAQTGKVAGTATTDQSGDFHLALPAGKYKLEAKSGRNWTYSEDVTVTANRWLKLKSHFRYSGPPIPVASHGRVARANLGANQFKVA